jgi:NAD+ kinase
VSPTHRALLLTPVAPHMLFDRTLVLDASETIRLEILGPDASLSVDGRASGTLHTGQSVVCTAGPHSARLVTFGGRDFHQILKAKFGLADR